TGAVNRLCFSNDGRLLASKSWGGINHLWRTDTWVDVAILEEPPQSPFPKSLAFHPSAPVLATLGLGNKVIRIWDLDMATLLGMASSSIHYTTAKIALVGDSGVGKT